jgi:hypothetical protein
MFVSFTAIFGRELKNFGGYARKKGNKRPKFWKSITSIKKMETHTKCSSW